MNVADTLCAWLFERGVDHLFLLGGSQLAPLLGAVGRTPGIRGVVAAHELGAGFMADGYARGGAAPGVCAAIGGPGAANLLPAAQASGRDGVPVLYLTGDVATDAGGKGAFQDAGTTGTGDGELFRHVLGHSRRVGSPEELPAALAEVGARLTRGQGAHLTFPIDVLAAPFAEPVPAEPPDRESTVTPPDVLLEELAAAGRILAMLGDRLGRGPGPEAARDFLEAWEIPAVTTLGAKGLLPETHRLSRGNAGYAAPPRGNHTLREGGHDLLLVLGADLGERNGLAWDPALRDGRRVVRLDVRGAPATQGWTPDLDLRVADLPAALRALAAEAPGDRKSVEAEATEAPGERNSGLSARGALACLREILPSEGSLLVDSGLAKVLAGQEWLAPRPGRFHCSAATGPTGWAVPAAVGLGCAAPGRAVAVLTGDGSSLMHVTELAVAARDRRPVVVLQLDNGGHGGMLRRPDLTSGTRELLLTPPVDWRGLVLSLGAAYAAPDDLEGLENALRRAFDTAGPTLVRVEVGLDESLRNPDAVFLSYERFLGER